MSSWLGQAPTVWRTWWFWTGRSSAPRCGRSPAPVCWRSSRTPALMRKSRTSGSFDQTSALFTQKCKGTCLSLIFNLSQVCKINRTFRDKCQYASELLCLTMDFLNIWFLISRSVCFSLQIVDLATGWTGRGSCRRQTFCKKINTLIHSLVTTPPRRHSVSNLIGCFWLIKSLPSTS